MFDQLLGRSAVGNFSDHLLLVDTASRGPTTIVAPGSQFRTCPSDHDSIGYPRMSASGESSTTMHRLLHASGSHPIPPPDDPKTDEIYTDGFSSSNLAGTDSGEKEAAAAAVGGGGSLREEGRLL
ncbi:Cyclin-like F-box domain containing protein [Dorcoceras hygrometricum]|uniref:Cyclin-like F-box domain containing protein n=1 Tax=Dorcoceras hygrometricum TaxID=472368 RepID=A0A2Z7BZS8_9LAMI|nr:Cyclin-like F-box domain containing protein [Dorcoceras hygrometricum]